MDLLTLSTISVGAIDSAAGGIVGNLADRTFCQLISNVRQRFQEEQLPANNELQKAARKAYLQATRTVCFALYQQWGVTPTEWKRSPQYHIGHRPELSRLDNIRDGLNRELQQLPKATTIPFTGAETQVEQLLQPRDRSNEEIIEELRSVLKENLLEELEQEYGELPEGLIQTVHEGWQEGDAHFGWFDLVCAFFAEELKTNEGANSILQNQILTGLKVDNQYSQVSIEELQASMKGLNKGLAQRFDQVEELLNQLRSEIGDITEVKQQLENSLPQLFLRFDNTETILETIRRELRHRPLYEQYAVREVRERVTQIIEEHAQLFVGREAELQQLDRFLAEYTSGLLLVTAGAGFGKSALLANWKQKLQQEKCFIVYHSFSARFSITQSPRRAYRHLLQQLYIYYELSDEFLPNEEQQLRDTLLGLIQDRGAREDEPLVIVSDGLDEAEELFDPLFQDCWPSNVFIIASARSTEEKEPKYLRRWLDIIQAGGGDSLTLDRLSKEGIAQWLRQAGEGELASYAEEDAFVEELEQTTEGFPLYLRFLIDELVQEVNEEKNIRELLDQTPQGFHNYVKEQCRRIDELELPEERWHLFTLLAAAKGALSQDDVKALTGMRDRDLRRLHQDWQITRWLQITSDGHLSSYAFTHPLLGTTFANVLGDDAEYALDKLLEYCGKWQEHQSHYALQYYAAHLRDAQQWDELYELARNEEFALAQRQSLLEEVDLPLKTVQIALQGAAKNDDAARMAELILLHAQRHLRKTSQDSPLQELRTGGLRRACELADLYKRERSVLWYLLLAWNLKEAEKREAALETLARLQKKKLPYLSGWQGNCAACILVNFSTLDEEIFIYLQKQILNDRDRFYLCQELAKINLFSAATQSARQINNDSKKLQLLSEIALGQAQAGYAQEIQSFSQEALQSAWQIWPGLEQVQALSKIAQVQAQAGYAQEAQSTFQKALQSARQTESESEKARALSNIAWGQTQAGHAQEAQTIFQEAVQSAGQIRDKTVKTQALSEIAQGQAQVGYAQEAFQSARQVGDKSVKARTLIEIAHVQAQAGYAQEAQSIFKEAFESAGQIGRDNSAKFQVLSEIAQGQAQAGYAQEAQSTFQEALQRARQIGRNLRQAQALSKIAQGQAQAGYAQDAQSTFQKALQSAGQIGDKSAKIQALSEIAQVQAQAGYSQQAQFTSQAAFQNARQIIDKSAKARLLIEIARVQAQAGYAQEAQSTSQEALQSASQIIDKDEPVKAQALTEIARVQTQAGYAQEAQSTFQKAFQSAKQVWPESEKARALSNIAWGQIQTGYAQEAQSTFQKALQSARQFIDKSTKARLLIEIARVQAQAGYAQEAQSTSQEALKQKALQSSGQIWPEPEKAEALSKIAQVQARAGLPEQSLKTANLILSNCNKHFPKVAASLVETGDRENFKQFLIPCAYYLDVTYEMCGLLAQLHPEQASAIAEIVGR